MPTIISHHRVFTPSSLAEALQFMADHRDEDWHPVAGGTDVMKQIYGNRAATQRWINLEPLRSELASIDDDGGYVRVGALTTITELRRSSLLHRACPLIREAGGAAGSLQRQNRATVGGRIASASTSDETLVVWLALDATIELTSQNATRQLSLRQLLSGDCRDGIAPDELLTALLLRHSVPQRRRLLFCKVASRAAGAIGKVLFAAIARFDSQGRYGDLRLAIGGVGATPLRAAGAEAVAKNRHPTDAIGEQAANRLLDDLAPIDDHRSTADYRHRVARNLARAFVAGHIGTWETVPGDSEPIDLDA